MAASFCLVVLALLFSRTTSLSSIPVANKLFRKSSLLPWNYVDDKLVLGHCVEEIDNDSNVMTIRTWTTEGSDMLTLTFPKNNATGEGLGSQLWPCALASSILMRSPEFREWVKGKDVVELGSGRGLAGLVAGADAKSCLLTDNDQQAVDILETATCPENQERLKADLSTRQLDWRDDHRGQVSFADVVLGSDIAYYWFLLRPIMDTSRAFMDAKKSDDKAKDASSTMVVFGQANRESQWDLYNNIKNGSYVQLTDENEPPWPGNCRKLLYNLRIYEWCDSLEACDEKTDGVIPISMIVHNDDTSIVDDTLQLSPFQSHAHVATKEDDESIMKTF
jgi:hypothetical protein